MSDTNSKIPPVLATTYFCRQKTFDEIISEFSKFQIKMFYNDKKRMLFNAYHLLKGKPKNTYAQECNGLILEIGTWRPLVVPPRSLRFNIDTAKADEFLQQSTYTVYEAQYGTLVHLYYYNNMWIISTSRGYQMNDVAWDNGQTFQQILVAILGTLGLSWQEFTNYLSKTSCYTFGFKHKEMHKFMPKGEPPCKIWFVQSVELDEQSENYLWVNDSSPIGLIPGQKRVPKPNQMQELYNAATNSLNQYFSSGKVCYGFILRSNNFEHTELHSDLFVESKLKHNIKKIWEDNESNMYCNKNKISKSLFVSLREYLIRNPLFLQLFPAFSNVFACYDSIMNEIVKACIVCWKELNGQIMPVGQQSNQPNSSNQPNQPNQTDRQYKFIQPIISSLVTKFNQMQLVKINTSEPMLQHIMREFLLNPNFIIELLDLFKPNLPDKIFDSD